MRFFSKSLADRLMPAFAHLPLVSTRAVVSINLADGAHMRLVPPWSDDEFMINQTVIMPKNSTFHGVYVSGEESMNFYDEDSETAYFWTNDVEALPGWVIGAPLRAIFHWIFSAREIQLVHGAAVGRGHESVLLTAKSGSGKSTTALACVLSGMTYLGDDYVGVSVGADGIVAHSLYDSAKMTPHTQEMFPEYAGHVVSVPSADDRKSVVYVSQVFPKQVLHASHIRAILIPAIDGEAKTSSLIPARKYEALRALAPTVFFQLPDTDQSLMGRLAEIVARVPCYHLRLGSDVRAIPDALDSVFSASSL